MTGSIVDRRMSQGAHELSGSSKDGGLSTRFYTPDSELRNPRTLLNGMIKDLRSSYELAWRLAVRDISAQYRQSYFGFLWAFITPLATTAAWIFLNSSGVVRVEDTGLPYPVYVFTGTMLWQLLIEAVQSPLVQTTAARSMLTKLNFPREAVILAGGIKLLSSAGTKLLILVPAVFLLGAEPDEHLFLIPLAMIALIIVGMAAGLIIAPLGMIYSDVGKAIPLIAQFAIYLSPVVFSMPAGGKLLSIFKWNPATPIILTGRAWLTGSGSPVLAYFLWVTGISVIILFLGWILYRITMPVMVERMSP